MTAVAVQLEELDGAAAALATEGVWLDLLQTVARLEAAAAAVAGTEVGAAADRVAEQVRRTLASFRVLLAARGRQLSGAAERYELVDRLAMRTTGASR